MRLTTRGSMAIILLVGVAALIFYVMRPVPVAVETARATRGPLRATIDEEGRTRVRRRWVVAAPVTGRLALIQLDEGDPVEPGMVVASIHPLPLDPRSAEGATARLRAAEAGVKEAGARVVQARAQLEEASRTLRRLERLALEAQVSAEELDRARTSERIRTIELEAAECRAQSAAFEAESARAVLLEAVPDAAGRRAAVAVRAPARGRVLRIFEESERVVPAGTPLLEVGDLSSLEVVVEVVSDDALLVRPGAAILIEAPGESPDLEARVRLVEPSGFTKVSPLGVEEQRVKVLGDFTGAPSALGDRYRVDASIVTWQADDVLQVPAGAPFRDGDGWSVFAVQDGRARRREVSLGHRSATRVEILAGLEDGAQVVVHPPDELRDGGRVEPAQREEAPAGG